MTSDQSSNNKFLYHQFKYLKIALITQKYFPEKKKVNSKSGAGNVQYEPPFNIPGSKNFLGLYLRTQVSTSRGFHWLKMRQFELQ